jgi:hypothetical protein
MLPILMIGSVGKRFEDHHQEEKKLSNLKKLMLAILTGSNAYQCFTNAFSRTLACIPKSKLKQWAYCSLVHMLR